MKKRIAFILSAIGWLMLFAALFMLCIRHTAFDPGLYHKLQTKADILAYAGISNDDLFRLDISLADYLSGKTDTPNMDVAVFGVKQPAFNEKELIHLEDCRKLLALTVNVPLNIFLAVAGALLTSAGQKGVPKRAVPGPMWTASALIILPIVLLGCWAVMDFNSAFNFFHKLLFTNDLWLLDPRTDLLIRICPASMFANMGLRIGLMSAAVLIGIPAVLTIVHHLPERKRKTNETDL